MAEPGALDGGREEIKAVRGTMYGRKQAIREGDGRRWVSLPSLCFASAGKRIFERRTRSVF